MNSFSQVTNKNMCVFIIMGPVSGFFAGQAGKAIGGKGIKGDVLGGLFGAAGSLLPWYETGGKVTHTGPAMVHKSEYILPANAKPTKRQRAIVKKNKQKANMPPRDPRRGKKRKCKK